MKIQPGCHITPITALEKNLFISLCLGFLSVTGKFLWSTALVIWLGRLGFSCGRIRGRGVEAKRVFPDNVLSCSQQTARKVHYHEKQCPQTEPVSPELLPWLSNCKGETSLTWSSDSLLHSAADTGEEDSCCLFLQPKWEKWYLIRQQ